MRVNSIVHINTERIRQLNEAAVRALEKTGEYLHTEVVQAEVVPRMDGALQGESFSVNYSDSRNGKVSLIHSTPYARRLYYHPEYRFRQEPWQEEVIRDGRVVTLSHDGNPNAKGKWYEDWLPGGKKENDCKKAFKKFYKEEGNL